MDGQEFDLPLGFAMALASNPGAMSSFLQLDNEHQDYIISKARETKTKREMQQLVNGMDNRQTAE